MNDYQASKMEFYSHLVKNNLPPAQPAPTRDEIVNESYRKTGSAKSNYLSVVTAAKGKNAGLIKHVGAKLPPEKKDGDAAETFTKFATNTGKSLYNVAESMAKSLTPDGMIKLVENNYISSSIFYAQHMDQVLKKFDDFRAELNNFAKATPYQRARKLGTVFGAIIPFSFGEKGAVGDAGAENSFFYRAMSHDEFAGLEANGGLTHKAPHELFVSTQEHYSRGYLGKPGHDVLVKFETKGGTLDLLAQNGVRNNNVGRWGYNHLANVESGWMERGQFLFKYEKRVLTVGLGNPSTFNL